MSTPGTSDPEAFVEVADRVWVARHAWYDVNVTVIGGAAGLVVVDTLASEAAAAPMRDRVRRLVSRTTPVVAVVNTHEHHDHVLGNAVFTDAWPDLFVHAHEEAADRIPTVVPASVAARVAAGEPRAAEMAASRVVVPTQTLSSVGALDLGDRYVELVHPGRAHTAGDLCLRVPDADLLVAGDVVEAADDPALAVPAYGDDSWPLDWPAALDLVVGVTTPASVVVPGHGPVVDREFVEAQREGVATVASTIADLAGRGVRPEDALGAATWPWPVDRLTEAVRRGFAQLPPGARRLPMA